MRERVIKLFTGEPGAVEWQVNDYLAQKGVMVCDRVTVRHWGIDPVSVLVCAERDQGDPEVMEHVNSLIASVKLEKGVAL